jgi:hypothetical protein
MDQFLGIFNRGKRRFIKWTKSLLAKFEDGFSCVTGNHVMRFLFRGKLGLFFGEESSSFFSEAFSVFFTEQFVLALGDYFARFGTITLVRSLLFIAMERSKTVSSIAHTLSTISSDEYRLVKRNSNSTINALTVYSLPMALSLLLFDVGREL